MDSKNSSTTVNSDKECLRCFIKCTACPALVTHYVMAAVNGSTTMRSGHVFNENVMYAQQWVTVDTANR